MASPVNWNNVSMLTNGLKNLGMQINNAFPFRDGASDGAIGDYQHTQEKSGHNPDDTDQNNAEWDGDSDNKPEIRAIDVDSDFGEGIDAQDVVDHIRRLPNVSSVLRYIIYNRKIYEASNDWNARTYTGSSPHTEHIHFSGARSDASDENKTYNYKLGDIPVALTSADKSWILDQLNDIADKVWSTKIGNTNWPNRNAKQALNDLSTLRDAQVDPSITLEEAGISNNVPFARIIEAADKVLAETPATGS